MTKLELEYNKGFETGALAAIEHVAKSYNLNYCRLLEDWLKRLAQLHGKPAEVVEP